MTDRQPTQIRETRPELQNKTADEIRREICLMQIAYYDALREQDRSINVIGWALCSVFIVIFVATLALLIW
jgi:hypothetical protein